MIGIWKGALNQNNDNRTKVVLVTRNEDLEIKGAPNLLQAGYSKGYRHVRHLVYPASY